MAELPAATGTENPETSVSDKVPMPEDTFASCVTKDAVLLATERLSQLTVKNHGINASILEMRLTSFEELLSMLKSRRIWIDQIVRPELSDEQRQMTSELLSERIRQMYMKEENLIGMEDMLCFHRSVLNHARAAFEELETKVEAFETALNRSGYRGLCLEGFPQMQALAADLTAHASPPTPDIAHTSRATNVDQTEVAFGLFPVLPVEVRLMIFSASLPGPRVLTNDSIHNKRLSLLAVTTESRHLMQAKYERFLSPGTEYPHVGSNILYVDTEIDTIVKNLTRRSDEGPEISLFDLGSQSFHLGSFRLFTGLAKVKHLALALDVCRHNAGALFSQLQACCPNLKSLTLFPSSQMWRVGSSQDYPEYGCSSFPEQLRFIKFDSNFNDFHSFRRDCLIGREDKVNARRSLNALDSLSSPAELYRRTFPGYVQTYGRDWKPIIEVQLLLQWNPQLRGWQMQNLGDNDGSHHNSFIESGIVLDANGEALSRYDGVKELFAVISE